MGVFFKRMSGIYGSVVIPSIGITIGTMSSWSLLRREETPPGATGEWDLHAVFSYLNEFAWQSDGWEKEILLTVGDPRSGTQLRLKQAGNGRTVLDGKSLLIEGADLWQVPR